MLIIEKLRNILKIRENSDKKYQTENKEKILAKKRSYD